MPTKIATPIPTNFKAGKRFIEWSAVESAPRERCLRTTRRPRRAAVLEGFDGALRQQKGNRRSLNGHFDAGRDFDRGVGLGQLADFADDAAGGDNLVAFLQRLEPRLRFLGAA